MKKKVIIIVGILSALIFVFVGCSKSASDEMTASEPQTVYEKTAVEAEMGEDGGFGRTEEAVAFDADDAKNESAPNPASDDPEALSEKIIYNVYTSVSVEDVDVAVKSITEKVKALGGYISYANTYTSNGYNYANIEVRVPSENLSVMEEHTYSIGKVEEYTLSTDNVTENYYDIKARLDHSLSQEEQLLEILKQAKNVEEILLVRAELDQVQERIESYKGRIRVWDSLVDYSTMTYNIRPIPTLDTDTDDSPRIIKLDETWRAMKRGFNNSIIAVANFFSFLLRTLAVLFIPLLILGVIAVVIIVIVKSSRKRKKEKQEKK